MPKLVRATQRGYFGGILREPGEKFSIESDDQFSSVWMGSPDAPLEDEEASEEAVEKPASRPSLSETVIPKKCRGFRKTYKSADGRKSCSGDDAALAALKKWQGEGENNDVVGWNELADDDRKEKIEAEVADLLRDF